MTQDQLPGMPPRRGPNVWTHGPLREIDADKFGSEPNVPLPCGPEDFHEDDVSWPLVCGHRHVYRVTLRGKIPGAFRCRQCARLMRALLIWERAHGPLTVLNPLEAITWIIQHAAPYDLSPEHVYLVVSAICDHGLARGGPDPVLRCAYPLTLSEALAPFGIMLYGLK